MSQFSIACRGSQILKRKGPRPQWPHLLICEKQYNIINLKDWPQLSKYMKYTFTPIPTIPPFPSTTLTFPFGWLRGLEADLFSRLPGLMEWFWLSGLPLTPQSVASQAATVLCQDKVKDHSAFNQRSIHGSNACMQEISGRRRENGWRWLQRTWLRAVKARGKRVWASILMCSVERLRYAELWVSDIFIKLLSGRSSPHRWAWHIRMCRVHCRWIAPDRLPWLEKQGWYGHRAVASVNTCLNVALR